MIEMLKNRREALQKRGVKGFTLMEMLIVIAIIAVLVAIAIPVLGAQLDRAKAATDEANIRDGYAAVQVEILNATGTDASADGAYILQKNGGVLKSTVTTGTDPYVTQGAATSLGGTPNIGGAPNVASWTANQNITYNVENGAITSITSANAPTT